MKIATIRLVGLALILTACTEDRRRSDEVSTAQPSVAKVAAAAPEPASPAASSTISQPVIQPPAVSMDSALATDSSAESSMAAILDPRQPPAGINVALAALGGRVVSATSASATWKWGPERLIDGSPAAWASQYSDPQEIVIAFHQERQTRIAGVLVDTWTSVTNMDATNFYNLPRNVEVWVSTSAPTDGFVRVASASLTQLPVWQVITFPPVAAKYVKVVLLDTHAFMVLGEIQVLEASDGPSIVDDLPKNLALPALGGSVVRFTSQKAYRGRFGGLTGEMVGFLTDRGVSSTGWVSQDDKLPQDIVFAFRNDASAFIDRIVLNPQSAADASTWIREFSVALSDHPFEGFRDVGTFTLAGVPGDQTFRVNQEGRYMRLRLLSNHGNPKETSLGEVQIIEGTAPGYVSVLTRRVSATATPAAAEIIDDIDAVREVEPNNASAQANALVEGRRTRGTVEPLGEVDFFRFTVDRPSVLTLELLGRPAIRTSLTLQDEGGGVLKQWNPARGSGSRAEFSWEVGAGEQVFKLDEPPVSAFIALDTSGSLSPEDLTNLREAISAYIDEIRPTERYHLAWFSERTEVMTPELTGDPAALKEALRKLPKSGGFGTTLYDAIVKAADLLSATSGNRAILVVTDGDDVSSQIAYPAFWDFINRTRIPIYAVGIGPELQNYKPVLGTTPHRLLVHLTKVTGGRFFFARSSEELKTVFGEVAAELRTPSTYYLRPALSRGAGGLAVEVTGERIASVSAPAQIELILDGSGSMRRPIEGRSMMDIAKDVMSQVIERLPDDASVALRVYGHRIREKRAGDCRDTELVVPFQRIDKARMIEQVRRINALGTTPIAYTLQQVAGDFGGTPGEKLVILVTDGKEECKGDPGRVVEDLMKQGVKMRLNIVGFALADAATKSDMERVAQLTGGRFFDAANTKALTQAIEEALMVPFDVLDAAGARVGGGLTGQGRTDLPEGIYSVKVHAAGEPLEVPNVRIHEGGLTRIVLKKEGQTTGVQVIDP